MRSDAEELEQGLLEQQRLRDAVWAAFATREPCWAVRCPICTADMFVERVWGKENVLHEEVDPSGRLLRVIGCALDLQVDATCRTCGLSEPRQIYHLVGRQGVVTSPCPGSERGSICGLHSGHAGPCLYPRASRARRARSKKQH